jgi:hypothetical protein
VKSDRRTAIASLVAAGVTLPLLLLTTFPWLLWLIVPIAVLTVALGAGVERVARRERWLLPALVLASAGIALLSILTGLMNGLSDEPYSTPAYASLGPHLYTTPVSFHYVQYGQTFYEHSYDVYLPLLTFIQIPGLDYRWVAFAAWAAMVGWSWQRPRVAGGLAAPWIALLAANGQNDFVPLLALTLAIGVPLRRGRWAAEVIALGLKQFANVVLVGYHLLRREFLRAALAVGVTLAFLVPFLLIDPTAVWCHVVIADPGNGCQSRPWVFFVFKRNYWLYPTWVLLVFHRPIVARLRSFRERSAGGRRPALRPPSESESPGDG